MNIGDKKTVKNKLGIMTIKVIEKISKDIGNEHGNLGDFKSLRIEFYQNNWLSLYSRENSKLIYFIRTPEYSTDTPDVYKCEIIQDEVPEFDFIRMERENEN